MYLLYFSFEFPNQSLQASVLQERIPHKQLRQSSGILRAHSADQRALTALHGKPELCPEDNSTLYSV